MDNEYKKLKEQSVSNLSGTSAEEILFISCVTLLTTSVLSLGQKCVRKPTTRAPKKTRQGIETGSWGFNILESTLVVIPILLTSTILSDYLMYLILIIIILLVLLKITFKVPNLLPEKESSSYLQFLTNYRSHLLLDTAVSILAVDFLVYPRRLAKTELYGWGYMDAGVGAFILTAGIVAKEARVDTPLLSKGVMKREIINSLPVLIIGIVRALLVEMINYQKHVSEYGSHWNFFLTMAFTRIIGAKVKQYCSTFSSILFSFILILIYQLSLNFGLTNYIINENRENIIIANKEGLISLIGYVSLYLIGINLGTLIHQRMKNGISQWKNVSLLMFLGFSCHLLMYGAHYYIQPVSRRLVNLGYVLWMISLGSFHLAFHYVSHHLTGNDSKLFRAINQNGLFYFLLANILTGLINISVNTLMVGEYVAIFILYTYLLVISLTVLYLFDQGIRVKLPFVNKYK